MTLDDLRTSLVDAVEAAKTGAPGGVPIIEYDNRILVDLQTQTLPFVDAKVRFMNGTQADLSNAPIHRIDGALIICAVTKVGAGSSAALLILDHFYKQLQRKQFGGARTYMSRLAPSYTFKGWEYFPAVIPFWADIIS